MDSTVRTVTKIIAKPGKEAELQAMLLEFIKPILAEPGCLRYELWRGKPNLAEFIAIGEWQDEEAFQNHFRSDIVDEFLREIPEYVDRPPDTQWYTRLA